MVSHKVNVPDHVIKNVESIVKLQSQQEQHDTLHLKFLDRLAMMSSKPAFLYGLITFFFLWWLSSKLHRIGVLDLGIPDYHLHEQLLDTVALLLSTTLLIRQNRQDNLANQQSHLMLQLDLLTEQKIAKIIALLEELRADLPNVIDRRDHEAETMKEMTDPELVITILQENLQPLQ
ncbi:DUF1003 domain-containing protein [Alkalinema sp. FACHB-956]|uniref:DUF1003 domain-containing protein n=1 Tax=Alkalinema sp. FACHB-956 TaxID=2692768 RepID=UPI001686C886|nr:DUF1003 domain-containing protein [Alkalinema sp. FACHB-956]MBD2326094.1 DUF1003 domain-containing protein [Alkalinema sp. FACHB-956]